MGGRGLVDLDVVDLVDAHDEEVAQQQAQDANHRARKERWQQAKEFRCLDPGRESIAQCHW